MSKKLNKTLLVLAAATSISLSPLASYAADTVTEKTNSSTERDSDGNYVEKTSTESKDSAGTTTSTESKVKVDEKSDGSYKKTIETENKTDPKGLLNKSVTKSSETITNDNGKNENKYEDKASIESKNGTTGTAKSKESSVKVKTDANGNYKKTVESKSSTDPKGLNNKRTVKTTDTLEKKDGDKNYHHVKKVNGTTTEEDTVETK